LYTNQALAESEFSISSHDYEKTDNFGGMFLPSNEISIGINETKQISFKINPLKDFKEVNIAIIPFNELQHISGITTWTGTVNEGNEIKLTFELGVDINIDSFVVASVKSPNGEESIYYLHIIPPTEQEILYEPRKMQIIEPSQSNVFSSPSSVPRAAGGFITVQGTFLYNSLNPDTLQFEFKPMREVEVTLYDEEPLNQFTVVATGKTDDNGFISFFVSNDDGLFQDGLDVLLGIKAENVAARVIDPNSGPYESFTSIVSNVPDGGVVNYGTASPSSDQTNFAHLAADMALEERRWIADKVGFTRSQIDIEFPHSDTSPLFTWNQGGSFNEIHLPAQNIRAWDEFTMFHEYGHAVMYSAYGTSPPLGSGPGGGTAHFIYDESSFEFAMNEGWAEFMQAAVKNRPDKLAGVNIDTPYCILQGGCFGDIETNDFYNWFGSGDFDGDIVEGSIASIFWDILDFGSGDDDNISFGSETISFSRIWTVISLDNPTSINQFYTGFTSRFGLTTNLCNIYWNYGINKDTSLPSNPSSPTFSHSTGVWSSDNTVEVIWAGASDDCSGVQGYSRDFTTNQFTIPQETLELTGIFSTSQPLTSDPNWWFHLRTVDNAGKWSSGTLHVGPFFIDVTSPIVTITSPTDGDNVGDSFSVTWTGTDNHSGINHYEISLDSQPFVNKGTATSHSFSGISTGPHTVTVKAVDNVGNFQTDSINLENIPVPCSLPPPSGNWVIQSSCELQSSATVNMGDVIVKFDSVLTILSGVTLDIDFTQFNITIESGSGVLIKSGGKIT